ncbi:hypothetical protein ABZ714_08710 [Streptomyces sp. NPDC006798]|uniref:hypothetical protein n=1 Tax=Streptomyces sp. NPDC006798 TaxID=3155462 RepID=UPI0033C4112F
MPALPEDLIDLIHDLRRRLDRVSLAAVTRPAQGAVTGALTMTDAGRLSVRDGTDTELITLGAIGVNADGSQQQGALFRRDDGTLALGLYGSGDGRQSLSVQDRTGAVVVADDAAGAGLARPYVPIPLYPAPAAITSADWTRVLQGGMYLQHPRIAVGVWVQADPGTTVEARVRFLAADGTTAPLGQVVTATGTAFTEEVTALHGSPGYSWSNLYVEGRVTAGTGRAAVGVLYAEGRQS